MGRSAQIRSTQGLREVTLLSPGSTQGLGVGFAPSQARVHSGTSKSATCCPDLCPNPLASTCFTSSRHSGHPQVGGSVDRPRSKSVLEPVECDTRALRCLWAIQIMAEPPITHSPFPPLGSGAWGSEMLLRKIHPACPGRVRAQRLADHWTHMGRRPAADRAVLQLLLGSCSSSPRQRQVGRPERCTLEADRSPVKSKPLIRKHDFIY